MADWYCDKAGGSDITGDGSSGNPYETIQACLDDAGWSNGDRVLAKASADYTEKVTVLDTAAVIEGYDTTPGDGGRAVIDGESTRTNCIEVTNSAVSNVLVELLNLELKGATSHGLLYNRTTGGANSSFLMRNIRSHDNGGAGVYFDWNPTWGLLGVFCEFDNNSGSGIETAAYTMRLFLCSAHENGNRGFEGDGASPSVCVHCQAWGNANDGFYQIGSVINCSSDDATSGQGFYGSNNRHYIALFCSATNNGNYGFHDWDLLGSVIYCGSYSNTSGNFDATPHYELGTVTSDPQFIDESNGDLTLGASSPYVQIECAVGLIDSTYYGYADIGAMQRQVTGGLLSHRGMCGGLVG